ncbi:MAG: virulence factor [Ornithinimicrobium sp.]
MTEYQVTFWRELPSMVVAREGSEVAKTQLAGRLQGAIDEAAMRLGEIGSEDYLMGWTRGPWTPSEGTPDAVAQRVSSDLAEQWSRERVAAYLDDLGPRAATTE